MSLKITVLAKWPSDTDQKTNNKLVNGHVQSGCSIIIINSRKWQYSILCFYKKKQLHHMHKMPA